MTATTTNELQVLTPEQVQAYHERGYLLIEGAVSQAWLSRLQAASDDFVDESRTLSASNKKLALRSERVRTVELSAALEYESAEMSLDSATEIEPLIPVGSLTHRNLPEFWFRNIILGNTTFCLRHTADIFAVTLNFSFRGRAFLATLHYVADLDRSGRFQLHQYFV